MAGKIITLNCPSAAVLELCDCLRTYVNAAYPPGASDCAQAAREALMDIAVKLEQQIKNQQDFTLSRRLRSNIKAALQYCNEQQDNTLYTSLINTLNGAVLSEEDWQHILKEKLY